MKRHMYLATLLGCCLVAAMPAFAGNLYLTGHDYDFHCAFTQSACNAFRIAVQLARQGAPDKTKPVLFVDQGTELATAAANAGFAAQSPPITFTVVNPISSAFTAVALLTTNYSAIVFASDSNCGGCDNTSSGEVAINNRAVDIQNFFIAGGGLVYLAGAGSTIYYTSVPAGFRVSQQTPPNPPDPAGNGCISSPSPGPCYSLTSLGTALGLTNNDANCCITHNSFSPSNSEGGSSALLSVAELDASRNDETLFATSSPPPLPGEGGSTSAAVLTFPAGSNSSAIGTFNCASGQTPCPDTDAHSMKFTVGNVSSSFSFVLTATEVTGDGVCESGIPGNPADPIDCRFVRFFGEPAFNPSSSPTSTKVPFCYPYSHSKCVVYRVVGAPPPPGQTGSPYSGGVLEKIAWNNVSSAPAGYVDSPRMYDDPSNDQDGVNYPHISDPSGNGNVFPYSSTQPEDNQFVFDITTFFDPARGGVGMDPINGKGKTFNDFAVAWPLTLAQIQPPINSDGSSVFHTSRDVIPVKFTLSVDGTATCNLPPATISLTRLSGASPGAVAENTYITEGDSGSNFRVAGCQYRYKLAAKSLGAGTYVVSISINSKVVGSAFFTLKQGRKMGDD